MREKIGKKLNFLKENKNRIWYMLCFLALGIIDQRRGSAGGAVQMAASNCTGLVIAAMLLPSVRFSEWKHRIYMIWTMIASISSMAAVLWGRWGGRIIYQGQWITAVLNVAVLGYYVLYIIKNWGKIKEGGRVKNPVFMGLLLMFLLMFFSVHEGILPLWMFLMFGCFYLVGIPKMNREHFFQGMLDGIILWFFIQQTAAFIFRPYDIVRYHGMYATETPNGLFYLMVYCAFLCKWIWAKEQKKKRLLVDFYFIMAAGSISFMIFTGVRSAMLGAGVTTIVIYVIVDIIWHKKNSKWVLHLCIWGGCVMLMVPLAYGAIRYLPAVTHHPIWFYREYDEEKSVRSFDSWDSDRYISFERAIDHNIGRALYAIGIKTGSFAEAGWEDPLVIKAYAAEDINPGSSPDHPFVLSNPSANDSVNIRKTIFAYYLSHINLYGHKGEESSFYMEDGDLYSHAHNMLIQMAYSYGAIVGVLFLGIVLYSFVYYIIHSIKKPEDNKWICIVFFIAIFFYGMTELPILQGTISWTFLYLLFYFVGEDSFRIVERKKE